MCRPPQPPLDPGLMCCSYASTLLNLSPDAHGALRHTGALSYAELGTLVSESGGEYAYFLQGFSPKKVRHTWWAPIPSFLFAWVSVFLLKPSSLAIICLTCSEYFMRIFSVGTFDCLPPELSVKLFAATIISTVSSLCLPLSLPLPRSLFTGLLKVWFINTHCFCSCYILLFALDSSKVIPSPCGTFLRSFISIVYALSA